VLFGEKNNLGVLRIKTNVFSLFFTRQILHMLYRAPHVVLAVICVLLFDVGSSELASG